MRPLFDRRRVFAAVRRQLCVFGVLGWALVASCSLSASEDWRLGIKHKVFRESAREALDGALRWLSDGRCQRLLLEFRDERGSLLIERLAELGMSCQQYLRLISFVDGSLSPHCVDGKTLAFTAPGSRVVFICARHFQHTWRAQPEFAKAVLIHEMLHTLGLGENPPSSEYITGRVLKVCDR